MARFEDMSINLLRMPAKTGAGNQSSQVSLTLTPVAVAAATTAGQPFTIPGLVVGDMVFISDVPAGTAGALPVMAVVTALNTLTVYYVNATAGSVTPAAGAHRFLVIKTATAP